MMYRPDRIPAPTGWAMPIHPGDLWSDDPADVDYNQLVRAPYGPSHENMRRADPLYDLVILTDWNWPNSVPGRGSAIFIHQRRRPGYPTEGCIALRRDHLWWLAQRISETSHLIVM
jgi:L,D-peptidoglycan transpeptidase YkuD (ErfK/YbiS/YcfS/YnhG family)